ncbi:unnamed protein product [Orchesella dallaii]|uniref:Uncharacterized protein n=1 Tax=Orchesella dallaii TaxID=48710 RepID=A0ABP1RPJ6_9HEXA
MMPVPVSQEKPSEIPRSKASVLTPAIRKAVTLYKNTYGLLPPIIADIKLREHDIQLRILEPTWYSVLYAVTGIVSTTVGLLAVLIVLVKAYWFPLRFNLSVLQVCLFLSIEVAGWYMFTTARVYLSNMEPIRHINTLVSNEMPMGK